MSNMTSGMAPRPQVQDLMRLIPPELQNASFEEKMNYLKGLVTRNQNAGQAVGSPQVRPSPRPRPPPNFAAGGNNIQTTPGGTVGTPNANSGSAPPSNPVTAAVVHRLCAQAGITFQQFQSMSQQQQQSFMATQAAILRQQTNRAQGRSGGGTPNPQGQATTPGQGQGPRPSVPGGQQQQTQGSPAISALQPPPNINSQQSSQMPGGPLQNQAQAAAALAAAAAGNNPALQARLLQMRAQGQAIPQGLQSQLVAVAAAQNAGQAANIQGGAQVTNGMMGQQQQTQGGGSQNGPAMNNQSPRTLPTTIPPAQQGSGQTIVPLSSNAPGTPGTANGQNAAGASSQIEQQRALQEIQNILANLPEFLKMKEENRLSDQQMKMLDYIVKMKGPGTYGQFLRTQQSTTQRNEQPQAQRQLNQQNQQQRQQSLGTPGQSQENLALHAHQQQALFRQLQNMQQQQMSQASGNMDQQQLPGMLHQNNSASTPRPPALGLNGQGVATPNSQGTSSPVTMNTPVSMGTPSGSASGSATAAMAFKKIEDMSDEKRNIFFRNTPPIRRSYFTHVRALTDEQRRELFTRKPAISSQYQDYIREMNMQLRNAQQARNSPMNANAVPYNASPATVPSPIVNNQMPNANDASLNNTPGQMPGSLPVPLPNLQLPANRQRLLNQAQARQAQAGATGSMPNGLSQPGQLPLMGMNPQMQHAQNQVTAAAAAQVAALKAQVQNQTNLPLGVSQSPRSVQATPQIGQNAILPSNIRAGTPSRVASLAGNGLSSRQGSINGSPQLNSSPGLGGSNIMPGMHLPSNGMLGMSGIAQAMGQQQFQAQLAQIGQHAQAQLQANMQNQGQSQPGMPLALPGAPMGGQIPQPGMMPPIMPVGSQGALPPGMLPPGLGGQLNQMQTAQIAQMQARGRPIGFPSTNTMQQQQQGQAAECPPVSVDVQISQVLPASAKALPLVTRYPDTKPLHTSLTGGLAAGMTLGLPPHLQKPPSVGRYSAQFQRETALSGVAKLAMKGTIFEKLKNISKDGDEAEDDIGTTVSVYDNVAKEERVVIPAPADEDLVEVSSSPKTSKRKLANLAEAFYPEVNISEAAEDVLLELADEFIDTCIEFGCRLARHRKARKLEVQDIQFYLGRDYDINIPGFSSDAIRMDRLRNELKSAASNGAGPGGSIRAQRLAAVAQARAQLRQQAKVAKVAAAATAAVPTTTTTTGDLNTETSLTAAQSKIIVKS